MGIQGLLRNLHPLLVPPPSDNDAGDPNNRSNQQQPSRQFRGGGRRKSNSSNSKKSHNILQFANKSLAIDASSWLHKAAYTCAERLVESNERDPNARDPSAERDYTKYIIGRCDELLTFAQIDKIYLVFDGIRVPLKSGTNAARESKRRANIAEARRLLSLGRRKEASEKYRQCAKGNEQMARVVAGAVEAKWGKDDIGTNDNVRVKCVWSPYEADSQLAKLCVDGLAHAVVTEDSDVLVYSAVTRMPFPIIYKLDRNDGSCDVVTMDWLLNPKFLGAMNGSSGGGGGSSSRRRQRRRREQRERDLDYIYNDSPLISDDEEEEEKDGEAEEEEKDGAAAAETERHCCEVEYDDAGHALQGYAPVRRALPSPSSSSSTGGGGKSSKRRGSSGGASDGKTNAFLSYLRSFANKEASSPGAGVRLFVQSCVLSGCDYTLPTRLSKVGPVTAFRLVKDASHRESDIRFERVLKSLPAGSKLVKAKDNGSEDDEDADLDDEEDAEDDDDFLEGSPPDNDRDAKGKYEELLSKSQAVFYYHLVKELATGKIVPLVPHHKSSQETDGEQERSGLEAADETCRPCIERFESGLAFVGAASEALKNKPEPLPPLIGHHQSHHSRHYRRPAVPNNNGWLSTKKSSIDDGHVQHHKTHQKKPALPPWPNHRNHQPKKPVAAAAAPAQATQKKRGMDKFITKGPPKPTLGSTSRSSKTPISVGSSKAGGKTAIKSRGAATSNLPTRTKQRNPFASFTHSDGPSASSAAAAAATTKQKNPFAAFSSTATESKRAAKKSPPPPNGGMTSPFFTTEKFDYGGYTPPPGSSGKKKKKQPKSSNATVDQTGNVEAPQRDTGDNVCIDLFEDDNKDGKKQPNHHQPTKTPKSSAIDDDGGFDYGCIVEETPPILPAADGILSKFIQETKKSEGPRRVSTSPERTKNSSGNSQEEAIELDDDDGSDTEDDDATAMNQPTRNENHPNFNQPMNKPAPKSVNKHPVLSTHPATSQTSTTTASSSSRGKKKRPTSSSALLAGFVRQEKLMSASSSTSGGAKKRKKSSFYPSASTKGTTKTNQSQKKSNIAVGKRPKGNASLKDFMVPSSILNDR